MASAAATPRNPRLGEHGATDAPAAAMPNQPASPGGGASGRPGGAALRRAGGGERLAGTLGGCIMSPSAPRCPARRLRTSARVRNTLRCRIPEAYRVFNARKTPPKLHGYTIARDDLRWSDRRGDEDPSPERSS